MGKIPGKQFQAILERQLENNIEKLRLVMNVNVCVKAIIVSSCLTHTRHFTAIYEERERSIPIMRQINRHVN